RLLRFGSELVFSLCEQFGIEVVIMNRSEESSFEDDLVQDVLEIITIFSARLYGARSRKNQKFLQELKRAAENV
ncbi:MAG: IS607 family transposase, partial [Chlamydiota bacterium]